MGVPPYCAWVTVAVKVTGCPGPDGFCDETKVVEVGAGPTTCATEFDVLLANVVSPVYSALIVSVPPAARVEIEYVALPPLNVPVPRDVFPCEKVTVSPSAGAGETTAVNVTGCANADGFWEEVSVVVVFVKAAA